MNSAELEHFRARVRRRGLVALDTPERRRFLALTIEELADRLDFDRIARALGVSDEEASTWNGGEDDD